MKGLLPLMRSVLSIFLTGVGILYHVWGESARVYGYDHNQLVEDTNVIGPSRLLEMLAEWVESVNGEPDQS